MSTSCIHHDAVLLWEFLSVSLFECRICTKHLVVDSNDVLWEVDYLVNALLCKLNQHRLDAQQ